MLEVIKGFFSQFKLYVYLAIIVFFGSMWLFDRSVQYHAGVAYCTQQQENAKTQYEQRQKAEEQAAKQKAVEDATKAADHINALDVEKQKQIEKTNELSKTYPTPIICNLSDDELQSFNATITRLHGPANTNSPTKKPRSVQHPKSS